METLTNAATAVQAAIFGEATSPESTQVEPVSGELGDTTKGEPYDAGNTGCEYPFASAGRHMLMSSLQSYTHPL